MVIADLWILADTGALLETFSRSPMRLDLYYALALLILFGSRYISWTVLAFPLWVLLISVYILIDNLRRGSKADGG